MYSLQICQLIVVGIYTDAEEESGVAPVYDFHAAKFDEVRLVLLVSGSDKAMDFAFQTDFVVVL